MRVLDAVPVDISYGQIYVTSGDNSWTEQRTIGGQRNGLCGAGWPGGLSLMTALSDGQVLFTVDVEKAAPQLDDAWEDIVEVSFVPDTDVALTEMMGWGVWPIPLTPGVSYRVR